MVYETLEQVLAVPQPGLGTLGFEHVLSLSSSEQNGLIWSYIHIQATLSFCTQAMCCMVVLQETSRKCLETKSLSKGHTSSRVNRNESWHYLFTNCSAKCSNTFVTHSSEDGSLS